MQSWSCDDSKVETHTGEMMTDEIAESLLQELLAAEQVCPNNLHHFQLAMTHSSYLHEQGLPPWKGNERLEFLGDAVIGLIVTNALYRIYPESDEGYLSKIKSVVVSRATLGQCAQECGLVRPLRLGIGEMKSGGKKRISILAAVFESFVGALYLDQGLNNAERFCEKHLLPLIEELGRGNCAQDDKSRLQEIAQQKTGQIPRYRVIRSEGPDHDKWFSIEVSLHGKPIATGEGSSKKSAEQEAARIALERWESEGQEVLLNMGVSKDEDQTS